MSLNAWKAFSTLALVVVCSLVPHRRAEAQTTVTAGRLTGFTTGARILGIQNFRCDCTLSDGSGNTPRRFEFRSEPMILGVYDGSPADGLLEPGDYITHVDGRSILTAEGAKRLAEIGLDEDVRLTIRRDGRTMQVAIHTRETPSRTYVRASGGGSGYSAVWSSPPTPAVAPVPPGRGTGIVTPAVPAPRVWASAPTPAVPAVPPVPSGWFGFSIRCSNCAWSMGPTSGSSSTWNFDEVPEISMVSANSPAGRAGLRTGDRITHIDGISVLSSGGGRRFGSIVPGQKVKLTVKRGTTTLTRELTLGTRPEMRAAIAASIPRTPSAVAPPSLRREFRYSGKLDNVSVEVWSPGGPTVEKNGNTMVITVGPSVIRLKIDPEKTPE